MFEPFAQAIVENTALEEQRRALRMKRAFDCYIGHFPDTLKTKPEQANDNVKINKARVIVDKGVSFLFGNGVTITVESDDDSEEADDDPRQIYLDKCLKYNKQAILFHKYAMNGGIAGHAFMRIYEPLPGKAFPTLQVLNPEQVKVETAANNIDEVYSYTIVSNGLDPKTQKAINYRTVIENQTNGTWTIVDQQSRPDSTVWVTVSSTVWQHEYPPIIQNQNLPFPNEFWGISDIEDDVLDMNVAANFALSNSQRIIRYHASPLTVAKGVGGTTINKDVDGVIMLPSPSSSLENLEMKGDLKSTVVQYEKICESIHEVARVPAISTGTLTNLGQLSGVALQVLYQPLTEKTSTKRLHYGDAIETLCTVLLDMAGYPDVEVTLTWPEMLPADPLQERQVYLLEDQMGVVSKETIAERLGLDWDTEQERMTQEKQAAVEAAQAAMPPANPTVDPSANPAGPIPLPPILNARPVAGMKPEG